MFRPREKYHKKREKIVMWLGFEQIIQIRRALFKRGISPTEFFNCMFDSIINDDSNLEHFFSIIKEKQIQKIMRGEQKSIVEDTLYDMFENKFNHLKNDEIEDKEDL